MSGIIDFLRLFNWIDIFVFVLFLRVGFVSLRNGIVPELYKLAGAFLAVYLSLHYYCDFALFFKDNVLRVGNLPVEFLDTLAFTILAGLGYAFFVLIRFLLKRLGNAQIVPDVNKWGGFGLGLIRGLLSASLFFYLLLIPSIPYFNRSLNNSFSGAAILKLAPATYCWFWNNVMAKFQPNQQINKAVLQKGKGEIQLPGDN